MPVIVFASSKGGVGKTTSALTLSFVLTRYGQATTLIDADPNAPIVRWSERFRAGVPKNLTIKAALGTEVDEVIDDATDPFIIVDLEGSKNREVSVGLGRADLALIPMKGSQLDADEAANVIKLIRRQERIFRRPIPFRVFLSLTSPVIINRAAKNLVAQFQQQGIPMLKTEMMDRAAFQMPFAVGGTLYDLAKSDIRNPAAGIENAEAFAAEVRDCLLLDHARAGEGTNA
jgi:chromosome partitioning protein